MTTLDKFAGEQAGKARRDARSEDRFVCPRYMRKEGGKACVHYDAANKGACSLPDVFMCVEWLRTTGEFDAAQAGLDGMTQHKPAADQRVSSEGSASAERVGGFIRSPVSLDTVNADQLRALGAAGVECEFEQDDGSKLRVVAHRSDADALALDGGPLDVEITYDDLANVVTLAHAIPGTRLQKITRKGKG